MGEEEREKLCLRWDREWVLDEVSTKLCLERWAGFCQEAKHCPSSNPLSSNFTVCVCLFFFFYFQVTIFFIISFFFSTLTFLLKVHVSQVCILGQAGSEKSWRWIALWDLWVGAGSLHWRQPLKPSTCWNYFLSGRQDVIKLKDTGLGQNNKERNQVWKLFSRGLTANQEKF